MKRYYKFTFKIKEFALINLYVIHTRKYRFQFKMGIEMHIAFVIEMRFNSLKYEITNANIDF